MNKTYFNLRISFAGFPAYIPGSVISLVTTAPAPITVSSIILIGKIVALLPIDTLFPIIVGNQSLSSGEGFPDLNKSFVNITP